ncbi:hypothetical protein FD754_005862 [Muntiacus muntjak]|uniref:Raftlin family member 2 n=1 Tax=Muntiacus muntjak TaxID=9888 RepID=A0A5N3WN65_MUNMU|nr:hypothetical protein FD754_005862 [Muntiacus muntjak]
MGCGLRKLEDPDDSSPGKIFSTLKRPQVETKTEFAYEYVLLDFTLQASPNPEVIKINSILDIVAKVEDYYLKGYIVGAIHPVIQPVGQQKHLPASYLYRVVLSRLKLSTKHSTAPSGQRRPRLVIEECPLTYETQTNDVTKELIEKVNVAAKRGMRFVGFISQHSPSLKFCNGTNHDGDIESTLHVRHSPEENCKNWSEGTLSGQSSESGVEEELHHESGHCQMERDGSPSFSRSRKEDNKLYTVFNVFDDESTCWNYQEGILSMKVTRKGSVISTLDADWLELTTFYYKQGLSLIDSFVCWETSKGDHLSKSLEGFFIYEEEGSGVPGFGRKGNDAIVVEQWTVIERKGSRHMKSEDRSKVPSRSVSLDTDLLQPAESRSPPEDCLLAPSRECWMKEKRPAQLSSFSGSNSDSILRELDDGQFDQEDGVTQVTCM